MLNGKIELRSDSMTQPTVAMREAMAKAPVGDDGYGEDPTINELERKAASMFGKEAGLFVNSGTMGNLVCILAQTIPGQEIILDPESHIMLYESGGYARLGGLTVHTIPCKRGAFDSDAIESVIREDYSSLICVENTHNRASGAIISCSHLQKLRDVADRHGLRLHVDGARIFNSSVALNDNVAKLAFHANSLTFCLSKGLGCPAGALVVGDSTLIKRARQMRQLLGGSMRQTGILAAAGLFVLENLHSLETRMRCDHRNARHLAECLSRIDGLKVDASEVKTNIVYADISNITANSLDFVRMVAERGVNILPTTNSVVRMVTHQDVADDEIEVASPDFSYTYMKKPFALV